MKWKNNFNNDTNIQWCHTKNDSSHLFSCRQCPKSAPLFDCHQSYENEYSTLCEHDHILFAITVIIPLYTHISYMHAQCKHNQWQMQCTLQYCEWQTEKETFCSIVQLCQPYLKGFHCTVHELDLETANLWSVFYHVLKFWHNQIPLAEDKSCRVGFQWGNWEISIITSYCTSVLSNNKILIEMFMKPELGMHEHLQ